jgi:hypothetical protein
LTNIEQWAVLKDDLPLDLWKKFVKLSHWRASKPEETVAPILKQMSNLNSLHFESRSSQTDWLFALVPHPEKLTALRMNLDARQEHGGHNWRCLTALQSLYVFDHEENHIDLSCLTALQELFLNGYLGWTSPVGTNTNLTKLQIDYKRWQLNVDSYGIGKLKRLRELAMVMPDEQLDFKFLTHLPQLRKFFFLNDYDAAVPVELYQYIPQTLETLILDTEADLMLLTHLTNLEYLKLARMAINIEYVTSISNLTYLQMLHIAEDQSLNGIAKLTRLNELKLESELDGVQFSEDYLSDLSNLTNLTTLHWGLMDLSDSGMDVLKYLTNLERLSLEPQTCDEELGNLTFFSELTNLTQLRVGKTVNNEETFFNSIRQLTKLDSLSFYDIKSDERILDLTTLHNLTMLEIHISAPSVAFTGVHFTALTSLQMIWYDGNGDKLAYSNKELEQRMQYMLSFSYITPDD